MTASLLIGPLVTAFGGGVIFKGRNGWCGTFCPLGPIQRTYGQAPVNKVSQTCCTSCVGYRKKRPRLKVARLSIRGRLNPSKR